MLFLVLKIIVFPTPQLTKDTTIHWIKNKRKRNQAKVWLISVWTWSLLHVEIVCKAQPKKVDHNLLWRITLVLNILQRYTKCRLCCFYLRDVVTRCMHIFLLHLDCWRSKMLFRKTAICISRQFLSHVHNKTYGEGGQPYILRYA